MDPDELLTRLRALIQQARSADHQSEPDWVGQIHEALDLFTALDNWLSRGGFPPTDWTAPPPPPPRHVPVHTLDGASPPGAHAVRRTISRPVAGRCGCACSTGNGCGGCGHAGCAAR